MTDDGHADTELGDWVVGAPIGHGATSVVHRGHHRLHPDRAVAIKRWRTDTPVDRDAVAAIAREAAVLRELSHPAIMPVVDVVPDGPGVALVMPLAEGSLAARIDADGALPWREVADLGARIAAGLDAAHTVGVVHRDVTPSNILFGRELEPRLADFGASRLDTERQRIVGTPGYLDPEVVAGAESGPLADVYGLGVVLYEALAGQPPWAGTSPQAVVRAADRGVHLPLAELAPTAPANLAAIIEQAMRRAPSERFATAQQLHAALQQVALARSSSDGAGAATSGVAVAGAARVAGDADAPGLRPAAGADAPDRDVAAGLDAGGPGRSRRSVATTAATTDFGPRPMPPIEVDESRRPARMWVLLAVVVALPLVAAGWALATRLLSDEPASPVAAATSSPSPSGGSAAAPASSTSAPTSVGDPGGDPATWQPRTAPPPCDGTGEPADDQVLADVDGRGCGLPVTVRLANGQGEIVLPPEAGDLAGLYTFRGEPRAMLVGDWDGDGVDTPAMVVGTRGWVFAWPDWSTESATQTDDTIGGDDPLVVTDDRGADRVVPDGAA